MKKCQINRAAWWCSTHGCELNEKGECAKIKKRDPRVLPEPGDRVARVIINRNGVTGIFQRIVLKTCGDLVIYTRRRENRPCKAHLIDWRRWCKSAVVQFPPLPPRRTRMLSVPSALLAKLVQSLTDANMLLADTASPSEAHTHEIRQELVTEIRRLYFPKVPRNQPFV